MWSERFKDCLAYIEDYWQKTIHKSTLPAKNHSSQPNRDLLLLPYDYITPNDNKFIYAFYWDTFFMFKGLKGTKYEYVMDKMIRNFSYLYEIYGIIPNYNSLSALNRSQPPFFTSMILDTYLKNREEGSVTGFLTILFNRKKRIRLKEAINTAKREYSTVWIDKHNDFNHRVNGFNLSRYGDRDIGYAHTSEIESGWDFTSRFYNKCNYFLPIDLNTYLYKYELDFMKIAEIMHDKRELNNWHDKAAGRKKEINRLMWNENEGFFYDYNWHYNKQSDFLSLAGFTPLWAGLADFSQAEKMLKKLREFETEFGLTITAKKSKIKAVDFKNINENLKPALEDIFSPKQWDYPNIWPPLEYLTIIGLLRYGFINEAKTIMINSVKAHAALFKKYGTFFEKINSETNEPGFSFHYENQSGFGWTNAIFYRYIKILDFLESDQSIYKKKAHEDPPYDLSFIH